LYKDFAKSFNDADIVKILDIYPAGEKPIKGVNADLILNEMKNKKTIVDRYKGIDDILKTAVYGDIVLTLGAGDVWKEGEKLLNQL
jgi:UDP-N-acetylmuramate--alanine ligase